MNNSINKFSLRKENQEKNQKGKTKRNDLIVTHKKKIKSHYYNI